MEKLRVGLVFGGQSVEHEVSCRSAGGIYESLNRDLFYPVLIGVTKKGVFYMINEEKLLELFSKKEMFALDDHKEVLEAPLDFSKLSQLIDIAFPIIHGAMGEDGCLQGFFKCLNIPYVGPSVVDAALTMDKEMCKRLLRDSGILVADFLVFHSMKEFDGNEVEKKLGFPVFVKPSNSGSSLGVNKARNQHELEACVKEAFLFDHKVMVEEYIEGKEIEISVMGFEHPIVSLPGELIPTHDFYSYEAKYLDENGAKFELPAKLSKEMIEEVQAIALKAYKATYCTGMARIDFRLSVDSKLYFNEINTVPGFTSISLFPVLYSYSGISYAEVLTKLIGYGLERYEKDKHLRRNIDLKLMELAARS